MLVSSIRSDIQNQYQFVIIFHLHLIIIDIYQYF